MKTGSFDNIDKLLNELNLIPGTVLTIGGDSDFFSCCHLDIKPNEGNLKEGWIDSINVFFGEDGNIVTKFSITLKFNVRYYEYPTITVDKEWIDKNVGEIRIWSCKE